jgi:hypothetical protein
MPLSGSEAHAGFATPRSLDEPRRSPQLKRRVESLNDWTVTDRRQLSENSMKTFATNVRLPRGPHSRIRASAVARVGLTAD